MTEIYLGTGALSWRPFERQTDRYGAVWLMGTDDGRDVLDTLGMAVASGRYGSLEAEIVKRRPRAHIGDIARGMVPGLPAVGEKVMLGTGRAFIERDHHGATFGLNPEDGRDMDWLDPAALYRCHNHVVRLLFLPDEGPVPPRESAIFDPQRSPL